MLRLIQWIWTKAEERATERVITTLQGARTFHNQQAEIAYYKDKYEPQDKRDEYSDRYMRDIRRSPKEHSLIADEISLLIDSIAPPLKEERKD